MIGCEQRCWSTVRWKDVQNAVREHNPGLAKILDGLKGRAVPSLIVVRYPFGEEIVAGGAFRLPCKCKQCGELTGKLIKRTPIPLAFVLKNRVEVLESIEGYHGTEPLRILGPGDLFGVFEIAEWISKHPVLPPWTVTAGARTIIPLYQMINPMVRKALASVMKPNDEQLPVLQHTKGSGDLWHPKFWPLLKSTVRTIDKNWAVDILLLDADWTNLTLGQRLRAYLFETAWEQSRELRERGQTEAHHGSDVVSKILRIARGDSIGFTPSLQNDELGPFSLLQTKVFNALAEEIGRKSKGKTPNEKRTGQLPTLPLLLLPCRVAFGEDCAATGSSNVAYFSFNNPFVAKLKRLQKFSAEWKQIATEVRVKKQALDLAHVDLTFYMAQNADPDADLQSQTAYRTQFSASDFAEQLRLAHNAGWDEYIDLNTASAKGKNDRPALTAAHECVITKSQKGFFVSFARIASTT